MDETEPPNPALYVPCSEFLQQGDVFRVGIVTPLADAQQRLFRAADGRHGSVAFSEGANGKVFDRTELDETLLRMSGRTELHTTPFRPTPDGQLELVVVFAGFSEHFVIATQTCDVSGHDKKEVPYVMILPAKTLMEICQTEQFDLQGDARPKPIDDYLFERTGDSSLRSKIDPISYAEHLREFLEGWKPNDKNDIVNQKRIINYLNRIRRTSGHLYYLAADPAYQLPELMVDFCATYTVAIRQLVNFATRRVARIGDPYRDHFARTFADRISRIAIPQPSAAKPFQAPK